MITSNKPVAEAMQKVPVHAATDVTGFGLERSCCQHGDAGQS